MTSKRCLTCHEQIPATTAQRNRGRCQPCWNAFRTEGYDSLAYRINRGLAIERAHGLCEMCCVRLKAKQYEVHHRTPLTAGGTNEPGNLIVLCRDCHQAAHR